MNQENSDRKGMLETIIRQEEILQFERFTFEDAWQLGLMVREHLVRHGGNAAVDVTLGGVQLFHCGVGQPTPNNSRWIRRKMNVVLENWKSSLRVSLEMDSSGRTLESYGLDEADFALSGGSFPLLVMGQGVIGAVTVSGLPQTHDHQVVADALAEYLHTSIPSVL